MKLVKESTVAVRLSKDMRSAFHKKVKLEHDHDASSVMRHLIEQYLNGNIKLSQTENQNDNRK
jgi:hypothetical protein